MTKVYIVKNDNEILRIFTNKDYAKKFLDFLANDENYIVEKKVGEN